MTRVEAAGTARIQNAATGEIFEIEGRELEFEAVGAEERNMGPEIHHQAVLEHHSLGTLVWELWEYPVGIENLIETDVGGHVLIKDVQFGLVHEPDEEDFDDEDDKLDPAALKRELNARLALLPAQLDALDGALARLASPPMLGHNQPPEEYRLGLTELEVASARSGISDIRAELARPESPMSADSAALANAHGRLSAVAGKLGGWLKAGGLLASGGIVAGIGKAMGEQIWHDVPALQALLHSVLETLSAWIGALFAAQ